MLVGREDKIMLKKRYFIYARSPVVNEYGFCPYIVTNEEFQQFTHNSFDLENSLWVDPIFLRYCRVVDSVIAVKDTELILSEEKQQDVETPKGKVRIGFSGRKVSLLYAQYENTYLRGFKVVWKNLCLVNAMDFVPLDKSMGNGNVSIPKWNKRRSIKSIRYVHNQVESLLYQVDKEFQTMEEVEKDIESPAEVDISEIIGSMLF